MAQIERNDPSREISDANVSNKEPKDKIVLTEQTIPDASDQELVEFLEDLVRKDNLSHPLIRRATLELIHRNDERRELIMKKLTISAHT